MKSLELKPIHSNIVSTYLEDSIDRDRDVNAFVDILNAQESSCLIALDGMWGSGKTFFVKQVKMILDTCSLLEGKRDDDSEKIQRKWKELHGGNMPDLQSHLCVYYDAWENDNDADPMLSLVWSILQGVNEVSPFQDDSKIFEKAAAIAEVITGRSVSAIADAFKKSNVLDDLKRGKDIRHTIGEFFENLLVERADRLVIIVDELDRCKPDFAVRLLEQIKHYFSDDRITFVFATNLLELQHTISKYYGNGFDSCRYLDRFFDLRTELPPANLDKYYQSIGFHQEYVVDNVCNELIAKYGFSLREISRFINLVKIAVYKPTHDSRKFDFSFPDGKGKLFCLMYIVPLMIALKIKNISDYNTMVTGNNPRPFIVLLEAMTQKYYNMFDAFLNNNEVFNDKNRKPDSEAIVVTLEDKAIEIYNAIFNSSYYNRNYECNIGEYSFDRRTQATLNRASSLLSNYATYE